jgi:hypothetical protein
MLFGANRVNTVFYEKRNCISKLPQGGGHSAVLKKEDS